MRERAAAATPGRWYTEPNTHAGRVWVAMGRAHWPKADAEPLFQVRNEDRYEQREHDAAHIASWHPAVALAVAAWLEAHAPWCADDMADCDDEPCPALAVARAYLQESE